MHTFGQRVARHWKGLLLLLAIAMTGACIGGYALLSITVNGLPPEVFFNGQALLFQPASESKSDTINIAMISDAIGNHPFVIYTIFACGPQPYYASLLLAGDAQVDDMKQSVGLSLNSLKPQIQTITVNPDVLPSPHTVSFPGKSQLISISIPEVSSCRPAVYGKSITSEGTVRISGFLHAPLQRNWSGLRGLWHGPHASQAWPGLGSVDETGKYSIGGIGGDWISPALKGIVLADSNYLAWSVDSSMPTPAVPGHPSWAYSGQGAISPTANITDPESVALTQDWIVVLAIGVGVGGGLLASLFYDLIRPRSSQGNKRRENGKFTEVRDPKTLPPAARSKELRSWVVGIGILSLVAWAFRSYRRAKRP